MFFLKFFVSVHNSKLGVQTQCLSEMTEITIDWGYKWEDKFVDLIVQFKENRNKRIDTYTFL